MQAIFPNDYQHVLTMQHHPASFYCIITDGGEAVTLPPTGNLYLNFLTSTATLPTISSTAR